MTTGAPAPRYGGRNYVLLGRPIDWLRRHPVVVDTLWALLFGALSLNNAWTEHAQPWSMLSWALMMGPLVVRRRYPRAVFALIAFGAFVQWGANIVNGDRDIALLIGLYTVASTRPRRWGLAALGTCLFGLALAMVRWPDAYLLNYAFLFVAVLLAAVWVWGDSIGVRRAYFAGLEERARRLEHERDAKAAAAVAAERARIARELHDVVAHNVSVMVVQADGAGFALDSDPAKAREALATIAATGRTALQEMRRLLGVLRSTEDAALPGTPGLASSDPARPGAELAPQPGLTRIEPLVAQVRAAGLPVRVEVEGAARHLPAGLELAAYRIVQEALTNSLKHAGPEASAVVRLGFAERLLDVEVLDDGRGAAARMRDDGGGHGLVGMRERVAVYAGRLEAGPRAGGGFRVHAVLPVELEKGEP